MSGCFGNHPVDRWMEGQLNAYLDSLEVPPQCEDCEFIARCEEDSNFGNLDDCNLYSYEEQAEICRTCLFVQQCKEEGWYGYEGECALRDFETDATPLQLLVLRIQRWRRLREALRSERRIA